MDIDIKLPKIWLPVLKDKNPLVVINAGRRSGKTLLFQNFLPLSCFQTYVNNYGEKLTPWIGYYQATQTGAISTFWDRACESLKPIAAHIDNSKHVIRMKNGAKFSLDGIDMAKDRLRGTYKTKIFLDEAAFIKNFKIVNEVLIPQLFDVKGQLIIASTPKGYNDFYHIYQDALTNSKASTYHFISSQGGFIKEEDIPEFAKTLGLTQNEIRQEFYGEFITDSSFVYAEFVPSAHLCDQIYLADGEDIHWSWDFNMSPACHTVLSTIEDDGKILVFDELCEGNVYDNVKEFLRRYSSTRNARVHLYGDANGRHTYVNESPYDVIQAELIKAGFIVKLHGRKANSSVANRIQSVNSRLYNRTIEFGNTPKLIKDLERLRYSLGTREPDKTTDKTLSHSSDALGYFVWVVRPDRRDIEEQETELATFLKQMRSF